MLQELFYFSGLAVNVSLIYTLYRVNFLLKFEEKKEMKSLMRNEEGGAVHNLHSSQSVGNLFEKIDQEELIKEKLKKIGENKCNLRNWLNYIPIFTSKND